MAEVKIGWATRRARYKIPSDAVAKLHGLEKGVSYPVYVHGIFQVKDSDEADVYFICEFEDGRCCYATPNNIQFVDGGPEECD